MASKSELNCSLCKHFQERQDALVCRRYPPQMTVVMFPVRTAVSGATLQPAPVTGWPQVDRTDLCGEYTPRFELH